MYKRVIRSLISTSRNFRNGEILQNRSFAFSTRSLSYKTLPSATSKHFTRTFSTDDHKNESLLTEEYSDEESLEEDEQTEYSSNEDKPKKMPQIDIDNQKKIDEFLSQSPENAKLLKILELEVDMMRHNGERVPTFIKPRDWWELITLKSRSQRRKYLEFKFCIEKRKERLRKEKEDYQQDSDYHRDQKEQMRQRGDLTYSYGINFMFRRISIHTMTNMYNARAMTAIMFGHKIILDCGFEEHMTAREIKSCAKQILICCSHNRMHDYPFHLYLCNANPNGLLIRKLKNLIPSLYEPDYPLTITSKSYLEIFDRKKLLYLTPHVSNTITEYQPDTTYIIGAIVDKTFHTPLTLAKAKKEGIRMAKLPLDEYLEWGGGSGKNLPINHCFSIVQDVQNKPDWQAALKHVPRRKLRESRDKALERQVLKGKLFASDTDYSEEVLKNYNKPFREEFPRNETRTRFDNSRPTYTRNTERSFRPENRNEVSTTGSSNAGSQDFSHAARLKSRRQWSE